MYGLHVFIIDPVFKNNVLQVGAGTPWWPAPVIALGVCAASLAVIGLRTIPPLRQLFWG